MIFNGNGIRVLLGELPFALTIVVADVKLHLNVL